MKVLFLQRYLPQEMLGLGHLSTALRRAGHEPSVLLLPDSRWEERVRSLDPGLIAFSTTTGDHSFYFEVARRAKEILDVPTVFGGPHPSFLPDMALRPEVDFVCRGEGEETLAELATHLDRGEDVHGIANLAFEREGELVSNPVRSLITDLDSLGAPDRQPLYEAGPMYRDAERKVFLTQRGCAYNCSFCFHHAWRGKLYRVRPNQYMRKRSVANVIAEIDEVRRRWPMLFVHFVDDIFNIDDEWITEFCTEYPKAIGLPFDVILRTDLTTAEHMAQLRSAGCISARIAFESASDAVRNGICRKGTKIADLKNSARHVKEQGIRLTTLNLLGVPGSTLEDDLDTLQLNIECKVDHPLCSLLQPYPETDINEMTREMGIAVDDFDLFPEKFNRTSSVTMEHGRAIENLHKLFPIVVRFPFLMPVLRRAVRARLPRRLYLAVYLLWTEYLVSEQNRTYAEATGTATLATRVPVDFARRVWLKTGIKVRESIFGRRFSRRKLALLMETDTVSHAGG